MTPRHPPPLAVAILAFASLASPLIAQRPLDLERVASGLDNPLYAISPPGDADRLFIVEQGGRIKILRDGAILQTPFLDVSALTNGAHEQGLLGLAFHPDYDNNGWFYINYTDTSGHTNVDRITVSATDPDVADPQTRVNILFQNQPLEDHNGGCLAFGMDGYLYIGLGDGGGGSDPANRAQNPLDLLGKMLRIDIDQGLPYTIPPDNPFVGNPAGLDEIWSLGLRNPWRFGFDSSTGDCWIADVGVALWEEINFELAGDGGRNYGWRLKEGDHCFNPSTNCDPGGLTDPVHEYGHGGTPKRCSVTGGFVYRGERMATMQGRYFFADYCSGQVWSFRLSNGQATELLDHSVEFGVIGSITSFGQDGCGELYVVGQNGSIDQIIPAGLTVDTGTIVGGSDVTLDVSKATPSSNVWIAYSLVGIGSFPITALNVTLDLANPELLKRLVADSQGAASHTAQIPTSMSGTMAWAQAFELDQVSNVLVRTIE
jgi:glucose/arabinose dehydrogenase